MKINKELIGNWYLYKNSHNDIFVAKDVPSIEGTTVFLPNASLSGWMQLTHRGERLDDDTFYLGEWTIKSEDFNNLELPDLEKHTILEIQIVPSGNVYFY